MPMDQLSVQEYPPELLNHYGIPPPALSLPEFFSCHGPANRYKRPEPAGIRTGKQIAAVLISAFIQKKTVPMSSI